MTRQTGVRYADVIVNISSLNKSFQYSIPPELVERVVPGSAVLIPFGNAKEPRELL